MKTFWSIVVIILILGVAAGAARFAKPLTSPAITPGTPAAGGTATRLQVCPDEKIENKMPGPGGPKEPYYILKGERKEISEFDEAWVAANCVVSTQTVY